MACTRCVLRLPRADRHRPSTAPGNSSSPSRRPNASVSARFAMSMTEVAINPATKYSTDECHAPALPGGRSTAQRAHLLVERNDVGSRACPGKAGLCHACRSIFSCELVSKARICHDSDLWQARCALHSAEPFSISMESDPVILNKHSLGGNFLGQSFQYIRRNLAYGLKHPLAAILKPDLA